MNMILIYTSFVILFRLCGSTILSQNQSMFLPTSPDLQTLKGHLVQYRDGDVIIGALVPVHVKDKDEVCGRINEEGIQIIETINMVIDMINSNKSFLQGIKLGTLMIDTCGNSAHTLERIYENFIQYFGRRRPNSSIPAFAGVIGGFSNPVSFHTASLFQVFKIPQISPSTTTTIFDDKSMFPYFFRTDQSESSLADVTITLIKRERWNYISVVYENDLYGTLGYQKFHKLLQTNNVCVATALTLSKNPTSKYLRAVIKKLLRHKTAKAVFLFLEPQSVRRLILSAYNNQESKNHFTWITSDKAGELFSTENNNNDDDAHRNALSGLIGLVPERNEVLGVSEYISNHTLDEDLLTERKLNTKNPWFAEYLSWKLNCTLNEISRKNVSTSLNISHEFQARRCQPNSYVPMTAIVQSRQLQNVADAVLSFAYSLKRHINEVCNVSNGFCDVINKTGGTNRLGENLHRILKNISFTGINGKEFHFNTGQHVPTSYDILYYPTQACMDNASVLKWKVLGNYQGTESFLELESSELDNVTSVCGEECGPGEVIVAEEETCCWICQKCSEDEYVDVNKTSCRKCPKRKLPNHSRNGCEEIKIIYKRLNEVPEIVAFSLSGFGIIFTLVVAIIYAIYRKTAIICASSRELSFILLVGSILCYVNSFVMAVPASYIICTASRVLFSIGPALMYSALLTKTIRVIIIFNSTKLTPTEKKFLMPCSQVFLALGFTTVQCCVLAVWFAFEHSDAIVVYPEKLVAIKTCEDIKEIDVLIGLAYPMVLIAICTILAYFNRDIPTGFNEAKHIGVTMLVTCLVWIAFLPVFTTQKSLISLKVSSLSICLSLSATCATVCLFGYKCYLVLFKPERNTTRVVMSNRGGSVLPDRSQIKSRSLENITENPSYISGP